MIKWTKFNEERNNPKEFIHQFKTQLGALQVPETRYGSLLLGLCSVDAASKLEITKNLTWDEIENFFIQTFTNKDSLIENCIDLVQAAKKVTGIKTWLEKVSTIHKKWKSRTESAEEKLLALTNEMFIQNLPANLKDKIRAWQLQNKTIDWRLTEKLVFQLVKTYQPATDHFIPKTTPTAQNKVSIPASNPKFTKKLMKSRRCDFEEEFEYDNI